ncbi:hypothetical protein RHGRI_006900 [Rhododendron griersonianum]|uniref:Uncharacterized protein n=1 Tax=Rhododendron griersonianum TaxID=479676 RepID=A0AAV6KWX6_9ERIC|nr:hypothetical protein RHGRI_006900 [Rhododendron griersonianum]
MCRFNEGTSHIPASSQSPALWEELFTKVLKPDKNGHVRTIGLGPRPSQVYGTRYTRFHVEHVKDQLCAKLSAEVLGEMEMEMQVEITHRHYRGTMDRKTNSIEQAHIRNVDYDTKRKYILSAGTDSAVNLWLASLPTSDDFSSESLVESPTRRIDPLLNSFNDYEDSVYGLAWSSREPWIFASLSYDGRITSASPQEFDELLLVEAASVWIFEFIDTYGKITINGERSWKSIDTSNWEGAGRQLMGLETQRQLQIEFEDAQRPDRDVAISGLGWIAVEPISRSPGV